jgi:hypothetical protein
VHDWILRPSSQAADSKDAEPEVVAATPTYELDSRPALYKLDILLDTARGNQNFVESMLKTFINGTYNALRDLNHSLEVGNLQGLQATAHKMRPSLVHLQIQPAVVLVDKLENWEGDFSYDSLQPIVEAADRLLREVLAAMNTELEARHKPVAN